MRELTGLGAIAGAFDAIVFDQWGVLHNGTQRYRSARETISALAETPARLAILSNSGKRSQPNRARIAAMGFRIDDFSVVMTSGEALWQDCQSGRLGPIHRLFPICAKESDAFQWVEGLEAVELVSSPAEADGILLMGLADDADVNSGIRSNLDQGLARALPLFCSNPDKASPRANGVVVSSPGALAETYAKAGGVVHFYGKPYPAVFEALQRELGIDDPSRILMVGDSLEHDIAGAAAKGWKSLFIRGGLHAAAFSSELEIASSVECLSREARSPLPDYTMEFLCP
ncbi:MAG: TIGR01459 family HAD-type hydrolase [Rhizobiales bacterium]|nr:TIGR01459 family HAD-type hydrolase [Hyphomicrobiales bacterium]